MSLPRREFLSFAAGAGVLLAAPRIATAQTYPSRPVRVVVPFPPGGTVDITARLIAQSLSERLGQPFVIENRPGGGGGTGTETVVNAPSDGYTLLLASAGDSIRPSLYSNRKVDFIRDIAPVAGIARYPMVLVVNPSFPIKTVPELISYAKANPGKISIASGGTGTSPHLAAELLKMMAGVDMVHVAYRGSAAMLNDLVGGHVKVAFDPLPASIEHIRAGGVRVLAVAAAVRSPSLPDAPTMGDFLPGFEASGWTGFGVPRNTPSEVVGMLNKEINAGLADPKVRARLQELGTTVLGGSSADFGKLLVDETEKWAKVVKFAGIKVE